MQAVRLRAVRTRAIGRSIMGFLKRLEQASVGEDILPARAP
jgi:hypothetical protein